ncbi:AH receptor-interacting protein [Danaus plexippus]|uniref:AH receptor-interacting protein n=1 Tax=Danaus plexippus TaxID=13037 RepID=UPI002AAF1F3B|nr:AH receptor-interacting protein [Danaus plexippus]
MKMSTGTPITKNIIHVGKKYVPIEDGSKVYFHFQTWKLGKDRILIDDSRKMGKKEPMVLVIGHKFKLECWETIIKMMAIGEVASFHVKKELVYSYPFVSKTLREMGQEQRIKHSCTMTLHTEGIGYADLDGLINQPCDLEFVIELLKVENSSEYEKELWQMSTEEKFNMIPELKKKGNMLYGQKLFDEAEKAYTEALSILEQMMLRERKCDNEWITLNKIKIPILLNYAQCKLIKEEYYSVIEHCNTILQHDKDNEKALYRRAKAHTGAWNPDAAEEDFRRLKKLNPAMTAICDKELEYLKKLRHEKTEQDRDALKNLFGTEIAAS